VQKFRLDQLLVRKKLTASRSEAENWIKLGKVVVDGRVATRSGQFVLESARVNLQTNERYVSRAGLKLASVARDLALDFRGKIVLDVGSSTGGFTDFALQHGAKKVFAVDVGTDQLHPKLRGSPKIELYEKTDIRDVYLRPADASLRLASDPGRANCLPVLSCGPTAGKAESSPRGKEASACIELAAIPNIIVMDVSFISLREILPHIATLAVPKTQIVAMLKPQFEAEREQVTKGVIKNDAVRRQILKDFEVWAKRYFVVIDKKDSDVAGAKGNQERFYLLQLIS